MAVYTIADLHLSFGTDKPMDVFSGWANYTDRIYENWQKLIRPEDTVVIAGDISWAMDIRDTVRDFDYINKLNGKKILMKGNPSSDEQKKAANINGDALVDAKDASMILGYYSYISTGGTKTIAEYFGL